MLSEQGLELRVIEGYEFREHKYLANDVQRWAYTQEMCKAYFEIDIPDGAIVEDNIEKFNHLADFHQRSLICSVPVGLKPTTSRVFGRFSLLF